MVYKSKMDLITLIILGAIWGASFLFMRVAAPVLGPVALIQWRLIFATLVLIPFARKGGKKLTRAELSHLFVVGVINSALPFTLLAYSSVHLSAGMASMMNATAPFFAAIWGTLFFKQKLSARQSSGLVLGFLGVWILVSDKISFSNGLNASLLPFFTGIIAAACYGLSANYSKKNLAHLPTELVAFWNCFFASLALLPLSYDKNLPWEFSSQVLIYTVLLGVLSSAIAYLLYYRLLVRSGATQAIMVTFLIPVFACFWGWIFLAETITAKMMAGAAVVFWGIWRMIKK